jgi:glycosyltransferase involved in cell wall biosynthesis
VGRVMIITRDYPPIKNGLVDHTSLLIECLMKEYDTLTVVHQSSSGERIAAKQGLRTVDTFTYGKVSDLGTVFNTAIKFARPDVIILQYVPHMWGRAGFAPRVAALPLVMRIRYGIPVLTFLHELHYDWALNPKRAMLGLAHRYQLWLLAATSKALIVTNEYRRSRLARMWPGKVKRIPAGNVSARKALNLRRPAYPWPYITWYGTLSEGQRLEMLVEAYCKISGSIPELRLVLVGAFDTASDRIQCLIRMCEKHDVASRVVIEGFADEDRLCDILSGSVANVHVNCSGPSGRRGVIAAYLKSGRAMIAVDGYERDPEFVHMQNVLLVPDGDESKLSEAIQCIYEDVILRHRLETGGCSLFQEVFSDDAVTQGLVQLISSCIEPERCPVV